MPDDKILQILLSKIERIESGVQMVADLVPLKYDLGELSRIVGRDRDTLRKHLYTHYRDGRDYWQKGKNAKIYVARDAALGIRRYYDAKR